MKSRKLALRKETLVELNTQELQDVNGASGTPCELREFTQRCWTGYYPSLNAPCTELLPSVETG